MSTPRQRGSDKRGAQTSANSEAALPQLLPMELETVANQRSNNGWQEEMKRKVKEKEKCGKCGMRMRKCRMLIGCKECKACFHYKCIEREKNMEDSIREGRDGDARDVEQGKMGKYNEEDRGDRIEDSREKLEAINHRDLKVIRWNADGMSNKKEELEERMKMWKVDIILIQETKLRPKQRTPLFKRYATVRKDLKYIRKDEDRKGGGATHSDKRRHPLLKDTGMEGKSDRRLGSVY